MDKMYYVRIANAIVVGMGEALNFRMAFQTTPFGFVTLVVTAPDFPGLWNYAELLEDLSRATPFDLDQVEELVLRHAEKHPG